MTGLLILYIVLLLVFAGFSVLYLNEQISWNHVVGFSLIIAGVAFVFYGRA